MGIDCYPSVADVPATPDLTLIALPSAASLDAVVQCAGRGAKAVVMVNSGRSLRIPLLAIPGPPDLMRHPED